MAKPAVLLLALYVSFILIKFSAPVDASRPVSSRTRAELTNNNFGKGGGSGPSECDGKYHKNTEMIVALSTGWYDHGSRCGKNIQITANNGKTVVAMVVDECDEHRGCKNDIVDGSDAVWQALGLDVNVGIVPVIWIMV